MLLLYTKNTNKIRMAAASSLHNSTEKDRMHLPIHYKQNDYRQNERKIWWSYQLQKQ